MSVARSAASSSFSISPATIECRKSLRLVQRATCLPATLRGVTAEELVTRVEQTVEQLLAEIESHPSEVLYREPTPGDWPVMSTLAHLAELLPFWAHEGAGLAKSPGKQVGRGLDDPRRVGPIEEHGRDSLEAMVPRVRAGLAECVATLRAIPSEVWQTRGT